MLPTGTTLQQGRYTIQGLLGQGGFGITYVGVQSGLNRRVAIKEFFLSEYCERRGSMVYATGAKDASELVSLYRDKFIKEAQLIASLGHVPHIIQIYDIFEENQTAYYVMEFIDGGSLSSSVKRNGRLTERRAIDLTIQTAQALEVLHKHQTMHLDVKPANILLRQDEQEHDDVVLIDFGVSKHYDQGGHQTTSTPVALSKGYAPFEQYREGGVREFSPTTDIYSLGATLYNLVTGHIPPEAADLVDSPLARPHEVSEPLWQIIARSMSSRRHDRYQSMADLINALRKVPVEVEPATPVMPEPVTPKPEPRKPEPKTQASVATKLSTPTPPSQETRPAGSSETKAVKNKEKFKTSWIVGILCVLSLIPVAVYFGFYVGIWMIVGVLFLISLFAYLDYQDVSLLTLRGHTNRVESAAFSPDGQRIVSASGDRTIRIWDAQTGEQIGSPLTGHTGGVESAAFSPDGQRIVSASGDNTIRIWDAQTGEQIGNSLRGHTNWVRSAAFSPDGQRIVSASDDYTIRIWDAHTGEQIGSPLRGHTSSVWSAAFSPDGKRIVSASWDETIRIWDAHTGEQIGSPLRGHTNGVESAAFSPDGQRIVSASDDETIRIWDAQTGEQIGSPLTGHTNLVRSAAFSPDGKRIVSASGDKTIKIWDVSDI